MIGLLIVLIIVIVAYFLWKRKKSCATKRSICTNKPNALKREPAKQEVSLEEIPSSDPSQSDIIELAAYLREKKYPNWQIEKILENIRNAFVDVSLVIVKYKNLYEHQGPIDDDMLSY